MKPSALARHRRVLGVAALLLWTMAVHLAYYAAHKPLDAAVIAGWQESGMLLAQNGPALAGQAATAAGLLAAAGLSAAAMVIGAPLARWLTVDRECTRVETLALSVALGCGVIGTAALGLSAAQLLTAPAIFGLMGALGVAARLASIGIPPARKSTGTIGPALPVGVQRLLWAVLAALALVFFVRSLAPPIGWDSLVYHLTGPKLWLQAGGMVWGLDLPHTYFPALTEHLYAVALAVGGERAAQPLHAVAALATLALTGAIAERVVQRGAGPLTAVLLLSAASLSSLAGKAYVDWMLMLYATAALWATLRYRAQPDGVRTLALTGVMLGLAAATKYTAVGAALGIAAVVLTAPLPVMPRLRALATIAAVAALMFLPWAVRDIVLTGNPVYPFLFDGWNWDSWRTAWFSRPGTGLVQEPWRLLVVPWEVTALGAEGGLLYDGTVGPVFLSLLPAALLLIHQTPSLRPIALFIAAGYGLWLIGVAMSSLLLQVRLLYPVFPALAVLSAAALLSLRTWALPTVRVQRIVAAAIALDLALVVVGEVGRVGTERIVPVVLGAQTSGDYYGRILGEHARVVAGLDRAAGPNARVLFLWEPRTYLCPVHCGPDAQLFNFRDALRRASAPEAIAGNWRVQGYTHVLLHGAGLRYFTLPPTVEMEPEHIAALQAVESCCFVRTRGPSVAEAVRGDGERYTLYRLRDPS